jgi:hypothetical protein
VCSSDLQTASQKIASVVNLIAFTQDSDFHPEIKKMNSAAGFAIGIGFLWGAPAQA